MATAINPTDVINPLVVASCPANIHETLIAWGIKPQTDCATANILADLWSLTKTNAALGVVNPVNETDAMDIGKNNEFPTQVFPSHQDAGTSIEKYVSSEIMAWLFAFTTGSATKVATTAPGGFTYTVIPSDPVTQCINLPPFTYAELIRPSPNSVIDRAIVGCVVGDWTLTMSSGPGRANCRVTFNCPSTGRVTAPSTYSPFPTRVAEHFLNAAGATISINSIDYVLAQTFISLEFRWNNNVRLDTGFYPGSGTQNNYAVRGRMEYGTREMTLNFRARAVKGSTEYLNLMSGVEGPTAFGVTGAVIGGTDKHAFNISIPRSRTTAVVNGEDNGIVTVDCQTMLLQPVSGNIITMTATCTTDRILGL